MKNKGFTLIELLAVIVILAIIALIATPVILNIINDSRDNAKQRSAELVVSSVRTAYATAYMKSYTNGTTSGEAPYLSEVAEELKTQLDNAYILSTNEGIANATASSNTSDFSNANGGSIYIKTNDDVICTFTISTDPNNSSDTNYYLFLKDGGESTDTNTKCGEIVASKSAIKVGAFKVATGN